VNYLALYDSDWLRHCDLGDKPRTVTITKVEQGELRNGKTKSRKPVIHLKEFAKPLALNKTTGKAIATLYGANIEGWSNKQVELYPARTTFGSEEVDCIRIRAPRTNGKAPAPAWVKPLREALAALKLGHAEADEKQLKGPDREKCLRDYAMLYVGWATGREDITGLSDLTEEEAASVTAKALAGEMPS
jgi:hypothetical protein